jgi:polyhydroxyalkanoate synthesis regulator phasin
MTTKKDPKAGTKDKVEQGGHAADLATLVAQIPAPPQKATPWGRQEASALNKLGDDESERAQVALDELVKKGNLQSVLGPDVPETATIQQTRDTFAASEDGVRKAEELLAYWQQQNALARHEAVSVLQEVHREIQHRAEKHPEIRDGFETTEKFFEKRAEAIAEGQRLAREKKAAPKA